MIDISSVLLIHNPSTHEAEAAALEIESSLTRKGLLVSRDGDEGLAKTVDLLLVLGGDGYLMETIHRLDFPGTPILGVNYGTVGFLMNPRSCLSGLAESFEKGDYRLEEHPVLLAEACGLDGQRFSCCAFNDIVLERESGQSIRFTAFVDGREFNRYSGDGLIIATPGGSTAYNLAAGGPVIHPGIAAMVLTPLYPHRATPFSSLQFSIALPLDRNLRLVGDEARRRPIRMLIDGRTHDLIESVEVRDSGKRIHLLRSAESHFVESVARTFIGES